MNPDIALIRHFVAGTGEPVPFDANPLARLLGGRLLQADPAAGRLVLSFEPPEVFVQGAGVLQGGAIGAMLDFAATFAAMLALPDGQSLATSSLTTTFLRAAPAGRYLATGRVEKRGRRLVVATASLAPHGSPEPVAIATAVMPVIASGPD